MKRFILLLLICFAGKFSLHAQVPANDNCSGATNLGSLPTPAACPSGDGAVLTVSGTTVNGTQSVPYPSIIGCSTGGNQSTPAVDVWYSFVATGTVLNINLTSTFATPNIGLWTGPCGAQTAIDCARGSAAGNLTVTIQPLTPGQTYYLQISGNTATATGTFTLNIDNDLDCNNCLQISSFTSNPNPVNGTYQPGQTVQFCFTVSSYTQVSLNWLHGIQWTFGPGWNLASIVPVAPPQCPYDPTPGPGNAGDGAWGWYNSVTSSATGNTYGPGFFFDNFNVAGNDPGQNFGDPTNGSCSWTFCVTITTNAVCVQGQSLDITINTLADGESGSWTSPACSGDPNYVMNANMACCSAPTLVGTNISCNGGSNGTLTATPTTAGSPYTYTWSNSGGPFNTVTQATPSTVTGLVAGSYTVSITDANGCVTTASITLTQPTAVTSTTTSTNVTCNGACNGTASVTPSGGTSPYTYAWTPSGGTGSSASSLCPNNYSCTITDANGCQLTKTFSITQPPAITNTSSQVDLTCNAVCNGSATVVAAGGTGTYTYAWSPSGGTAATASSLCAGNYTCTISSPAGCTHTQTFTITQPPAITNTSSHVDVTCNAACNGTASVVASGGTGTYTYSWSPSGGTGATANSLCPGNYTCTISSPAGCTHTQTFTITQPPAITSTQSQVNVTCNAACNGSASVVASGGTGTYTYAWTPSGGTAATASSLCAGNYTCTISSPAGCTSTASFSITQNPAITSTQSQVNVSCNGSCNGSATVVAAGGTGTYTYNWAPSGGTGSTASSLCAGNYTCTISSPAGCTNTASFNITQPPVLTSTQSQVNVTCNAACTGSATVVASGGTGTYTYAWSPSGGTAATASSLCSGNYTCTISSPAGCTSTASFNITQPTAIASVNSSTDATCGGNNGTATVVASGGAGGYTYLWAPSGGNAATAIGLTAGSYTCTITDANGCTFQAIIAVNNAGAPTSTLSSSNNVLCNGGNNGSATVSASGGTGPYTYAWTPSGGNASTASNLTAGSYVCTVTDNNGCVSSTSVTITEPSLLTASMAFTPASCGGNDGTATVTPSGGAGGYTYSWAPTGGTGSTASGLSGGSYTCTITDANNCTTTATVTIANNSAPVATLQTSTDVLCFGGNTGSATASASGGTGPYSYAWTPSGGNAATASNLTAQSYTCTITDANGCTGTTSVTITEPPQLTLSIAGNAATCSANNGSATGTVGGGNPNYSYSWSSGGTSATESNLGAGTYTLTVTDANGCSVSETVSITQSGALGVTSATTSITCFGGTDGSATVTPTSGTSPYTYSWSSGGSNSTESGLPVGTYTCTVTDASGCTTTETVSVTQPTQLTATSSVVNESCFGNSTGTGTVNPSGGTASYTYSWAPSGGSNATTTGLPQGSYTCTITDANGCTTTSSVTITEPTQLTATSSSTNLTCFGSPTGTASVTPNGGTPTYTYAWAPTGGNAANASALGAGTYTCTITDANGCTQTQSVTITQPAQLTLNTQNDAVCSGTQATLSATAAGGVGPYTYSWTDGTNSANTSFTPSSTTTETVTITDANGCTTTASATATVNPQPVSSFTSNTTNGFFQLTNGAGNLCFTDASVNATAWLWDLNGTADITQSPCIAVTSADSGQFCATLTVTNSFVCIDSSVTCIIIGDISYVIPNVFTPNADNTNDVFIIQNSGMKTLHCEIYDRWGALVYKWDGPAGYWDGKSMNGMDAVDGVYYYALQLTDQNDKSYDLHGFVHLIRGK
jgi:gliding motility-associated-like protein